MCNTSSRIRLCASYKTCNAILWDPASRGQHVTAKRRLFSSMANEDLANRLSSLADSLRERGTPQPSSSRNSNESTSETLGRLFPSVRGRNTSQTSSNNTTSSRVSYSASSSSRSKRFEPYSKGKGKGKATSVPVLKDVILLPNPKICDVRQLLNLVECQLKRFCCQQA